MSGGSRKVVYTAIAGNLAIAATKLAAALWSGSSAMLSEAIHSAVDTTNQGLLLLGLRRAERGPSRGHPFGHGMELYFWAFVVALMIFGLGGIVSIYEGVRKLIHPAPMSHVWVNFVVIGAGAIFEGTSLRVAWSELKSRFPDATLLGAVTASKDPSVFATVLEDTAALVGLATAACGIGLSYVLGQPLWDALASIVIGLVLMLAATILSLETLSLLTGESASREVLDKARRVLEADDRVVRVDELLSFHLGPADILLALAIDFRDELNSPAIEDAIHDLTAALSKAIPAIKRVYVRPISRKDASPNAADTTDRIKNAWA
jgi:cation diffusion facilitator family transporter